MSDNYTNIADLKKPPPSPGFFNRHLNPIFAMTVFILFILNIVLYSYYFIYIKSQPLQLADLTSTPVINQLALSLDSPIDQLIISQNLVIINGKTEPTTPVVFYTEVDSNSVVSDELGRFEGSINLVAGINNLTVTAFADDGRERSINLDLVYDEDNVMGAKSGNNQNDNSQKNKATIGQVENVTTDAVIVEDQKTKKQTKIVIDKDTLILDKTNKKMTTPNFKLKDKVAVIASDSGLVDKKEIKALKVYVRQATDSAQIGQKKRHAIQGVINAINGQLITLVHQIQRERVSNIMVNAATVIKMKGKLTASLSDLVVGQRIVAVGDLDESNLLVAKLIHIIPGKAVGIFKKQPLATPSAIISETPTPTASTTPTIEPTIIETPTTTP